MAVKLKDLINVIETAAPLGLMESWDNAGLAIGDPEAMIQKVLVGMDVTGDLIDEAQMLGATLILTHHPLLFNRPNAITTLDPQGQNIRRLIKQDMNVYSAHTNLDKAKGGMNDQLMALVGFSNYGPLEEGILEGIGRISEINPIALGDLISHVSDQLGVKDIRYCGPTDQMICKVAVINGAGADFIMVAKAAGADCVITGDTKYHEMLDAQSTGIAVIDPGHFASEWPVFQMTMAKVQQTILKDLGEVEFNYSKVTQDPICFYRR